MPTSDSDDTDRFYRENAVSYAQRPRNAPAARLDEFLSRLPRGACVLELGCGSGQDSAYMLERGFDVRPTDGSPELAAEASRLLGRRVDVLRFEELCSLDAFDGIWAEACLLHVPRARFADVLGRIFRALKCGGVLAASLKSGEAEGRDRYGRFFNYPSRGYLTPLFEDAGWPEVEITETDGGSYDGTPTRWLHVTAVKPR
ncbi:class I SAM-dependent methyltransferase [Mesorhizobium plurifarium]|uniref:class I SAM-dependent methyltransferase n=1 Tax=Sinorhizobium arboris TaxID=76745 RepID=UPI000429DA18|nr:class I SAM-dependent methyltransferase [Sinorhizobium arboris]PST22030.1 class I SAM-dependent methyltransferase [Mesorhizobium plurifarium]